MDKIAFCSVAFTSKQFGDEYIKQQKRLKQSLISVYGDDADLFFWTNEYPENSRIHFDSSYGFKVHAIKHCLNLGYKKIIWLDTAMIVHSKLDFYFDMSPVACVFDSQKLKNVTMNRVKEYYNIDCDGWYLCGGSLFAFDFEKEKTHSVFNMWYQAERLGFFGCQTDESEGRQQGHRWDETMMSISLYTHNLSPICKEAADYDNKSIIDKKHCK